MFSVPGLGVEFGSDGKQVPLTALHVVQYRVVTVSQSDEFSEEELIRLMSALGSDGIDGGSDDTADASLIPMMQGMMKSLLSKDVLYPSLKDISTQVLKLYS